MNLVLAESAEEFNRVKLNLGAGLKRVASTLELRKALERYGDLRTLIIGPTIKEGRAFALAEELRITNPQIKIILLRNRVDMALLSQAMATGISNVVDALDGAALVNAVKTFEDLEVKRLALHQSGSLTANHGKVIFVYSAKGGCGKTTIATNLAATIARDGKSKVCLLDLDLQFGDVAVSLRLEPTKSVAEALEMDSNLDANSLAQLIVPFDELFDTLLAPTNSKTTLTPKVDQIERVINLLKSMYDYVIVDISTSFTETVRSIIDLSDIVLLITTLDLPAVKNLKMVLRTLEETDFPVTRRQVILNRSDLKVGLSRKDVEELISCEVFAEVPNSTEVSKAVNQGIPLVIKDPKHGFSKAIEKLWNQVREKIALENREKVA